MGASQPIRGFYDRPMWNEMESGNFTVQQCTQCEAYRYPPGPACPACGSLDHRWKSADGGGEILSWVIFHRQYFEDHPAPYNSVAVRLDEGPIVITNLTGPEPAGSWIGKRVQIEVIDRGGRLQHAVRLEMSPG